MNPPGSKEGVVDRHLDKASELLDAISPRSSTWDGDPLEWIFRGHADADWSLRPKAVRNLDLFPEHGIQRDQTRGAAWSERKRLLEQMLARFKKGLDAAGITIPLASPSITAEDLNQWTGGADPSLNAFPLMALAQHHGLPTILLDWSRRPFFAAYFAAVGAAESTDAAPGSHLAVWALNTTKASNMMFGLRVYEAPGSTNPNLRAQEGLFTGLSVADDPGLENHLAKLRREAKPVPELRRFTLPTIEARDLLRLLAIEGITGATMFPGADGVVRAMREERLWKFDK